MTPSEVAGAKWIMCAYGYQPYELRFQYKASPDLVAVDGAAWEIKRLKSRTAVFSLGQVVAMRARSQAVRVVFMRDGQPEPVLVELLTNIRMPGEWNGLKFLMRHQPYGAYAFNLDRELADRVFAAAFATPDPMGFIRRLSRKRAAEILGVPASDIRPKDEVAA